MKFLLYSALACTALVTFGAQAQPMQTQPPLSPTGGKMDKKKPAKEGSVQSLNDKFFTQFETWFQDAGKQDMTTFYAEDANVFIESELPWGGNYTGTDEIALFFKRVALTLFPEGQQTKITEKDFLVNVCDEAKGTCIVEGTGEETIRGTVIDYDYLHVVEWNQLTNKIIKHTVFNKDKQDTIDAYRTKAEKNLWEMIWAMFRVDPEELLDLNSKVWQYVADDVTVKLHFFPEDIMGGKTEWTGKQQVAELMKKKAELHHNSPMMNNMEEMMQHMKLDVLHATDNEVYATVPGHAVMHYTFNDEGKLMKEEVTMQGEVKPWQLYPFPAPFIKGPASSKKLKSLWEQISKELKKGDDDDNYDDDKDSFGRGGGGIFRPGVASPQPQRPIRQGGTAGQQ